MLLKGRDCGVRASCRCRTWRGMSDRTNPQQYAHPSLAPAVQDGHRTGRCVPGPVPVVDLRRPDQAADTSARTKPRRGWRGFDLTCDQYWVTRGGRSCLEVMVRFEEAGQRGAVQVDR